MASLERLIEGLRAATPTVESVGVEAGGSLTRPVVSLRAGASSADRAAMLAALAAFDFSDAAEAAWLADRRRAAALTAMGAGADPTALLVRAVMLAVFDEINLLRQAAGLQARTAAQLRNAVLGHVAAGAADPS